MRQDATTSTGPDTSVIDQIRPRPDASAPSPSLHEPNEPQIDRAQSDRGALYEPPLAGSASCGAIQGGISKTTELAPRDETRGNPPWYSPSASLRTPEDYDGKRNGNYDTMAEFPAIIAMSDAANMEEFQTSGDILVSCIKETLSARTDPQKNRRLHTRPRSPITH